MDEYDITDISAGKAGSILSSLYRKILLTLGVSAPLFSRLIYKHCVKYINPSSTAKGSLRNKETGLMNRLMEKDFNFDTFLTGLDVLGIEKFQLILSLHDGEIKDVKRFESDIVNVREHRDIIDGNKFLHGFFTKILRDENINDFDEGFYPLLKQHYKFLSISKSGKSFVSNLARAYRHEFVSWMVLYRLIAPLGFNNGTIAIILKHNGGRQTFHNKSFSIN